jgi:hypothetical protein
MPVPPLTGSEGWAVLTAEAEEGPNDAAGIIPTVRPEEGSVRVNPTGFAGTISACGRVGKPTAISALLVVEAAAGVELGSADIVKGEGGEREIVEACEETVRRIVQVRV